MATVVSTDGTPTNGSNPWLDSLVWGGAWSSGSAPKVTITYTFKSGTDPAQGNVVGKTWQASEMAAMRQAMAAWEAVANIDFVEKKNPGADTWLWLFDNRTMQGFSGSAEVPDPQEDVVKPLYLQLNTDDPAWKISGSLLQGGWSYSTLLHELGHLLGLAHPHDGGLRADANNFPGVTAAEDDFGDFNLNQNIYTIMSYNSGWLSKYPNHTSAAFGSSYTPMALDILAIQSLYGANTSHARGNDSYVLPASNAIGTGWRTIWDAAGIDTISAGGASRAFTINLNSATGTGAAAGGYGSYATGIIGGFTIAKGVVIENAKGGRAADKIIGNTAANALDGAEGDDKLYGGSGSDKLLGGAGNDLLDGGTGIDTVSYGSATTALDASLLRKSLLRHAEHGTDTFAGIENLTGGSGNDRLEGDGNANVLNGGKGVDRLLGGKGNDSYLVDSIGDWITEDTGGGTDTVTSTVSVTTVLAEKGIRAYVGPHIETIILSGTANAAVKGNSLANVITGNSGNNRLEGLGGNDKIVGSSGNDRIDGGAGSDTLTGGIGDDHFVFSTGLGSLDTITAFDADHDAMRLDQAIFAALSTGALAATSLVFGTEAVDSDDFIIFDGASRTLSYDRDASGTEEPVPFVTLGRLIGTLTADHIMVI